MNEPLCRACGSPLRLVMADLGLSPFSNAFVPPERAGEGEMFHPLRVLVCESCWLAQLDGATPAEKHFHEDYAYYSSFSISWLAHAREYAARMIGRFSLNTESQVVEIASNDGYLLQYFLQSGIACLGIEPSANTAAAACGKGVESWITFFNAECAARLAREGRQADLLTANNVLAHVPDLNGFVAAMPLALKPEGVITLEFPHLLRLIRESQFDTIYHEHYSYLSLTALAPVFARAGLRLFDAEELSTHGGSLRLYACLSEAKHRDSGAVAAIMEKEAALRDPGAYRDFARGMERIKRDFLEFLIQAGRDGKCVFAYGAAAKGNTLLNYCGVRGDLIQAVADRNPAKQGRLLPGSRLPVCTPQFLFAARPDYVLILPWSLRAELAAELEGVREWGGRLVVAIPGLEVF